MLTAGLAADEASDDNSGKENFLNRYATHLDQQNLIADGTSTTGSWVFPANYLFLRYRASVRVKRYFFKRNAHMIARRNPDVNPNVNVSKFLKGEGTRRS